MRQKIVQHSRRKFFDLFGASWKVDYQKSIFLFTHGRGGGTWLQELVAQALQVPMIFEPFTGDSFTALVKKHYEAIHTDRIDDKAPFLEYFQGVLDGSKLKGQHLFQNKFFIKKEGPAVIKFVNRTELIPLLNKHYKTDLPFIYLFRDPISILQSRVSYGKAMAEEVPLKQNHAEFSKYFQYLPFDGIPWEKLKTNYEFDVFKVYAHRYLVEQRFKDLPITFLDYTELKTKGPNSSKDLLMKVYGVSGMSSKKSSSARKTLQTVTNKGLDPDLLARLEQIKISMTELI